MKTDLGTFIGTGAERLIRDDLTTARFTIGAFGALGIIIIFIIGWAASMVGPAVV